MTADVLPLNGARRTAEEDQARRSVKALLARHEIKVEELAELAGMTRTTLFKRLSPRASSGQSFTLGEILAVAKVFGVTVDDLTAGRTDHSVLLKPERSVNNRNLTTRQAAA